MKWTYPAFAIRRRFIGCFKKVAPPLLKLLRIFSLRLSLVACNFANFLAIRIHKYLQIFVDCLNISSNGVNFSTSSHRFHIVKF